MNTKKQLISKGNTLNLPQMVRLKTFIDANLIDIDKRTLQRWCNDGFFPAGRRIGNFWYIDWRHFLMWFDDLSNRKSL